MLVILFVLLFFHSTTYAQKNSLLSSEVEERAMYIMYQMQKYLQEEIDKHKITIDETKADYNLLANVAKEMSSAWMTEHRELISPDFCIVRRSGRTQPEKFENYLRTNYGDLTFDNALLYCEANRFIENNKLHATQFTDSMYDTAIALAIKQLNDERWEKETNVSKEFHNNIEVEEGKKSPTLIQSIIRSIISFLEKLIA